MKFQLNLIAVFLVDISAYTIRLHVTGYSTIYIYLYVIILFLLNNVVYTYFHTPLLSLTLLSPSTYSLPTSPLTIHRLNLLSPLQVPTSLQEALSPCNLPTWGLDLAGERTTHHGCIY